MTVVKIPGWMKGSRLPDLIVNDCYLSRWWIVPRNPLFNVYLHRYIGSDDDRALHDHPWLSCSFLLKGELVEHQLNQRRCIPWLWPVIRSAKFLHRLELVKGPAWTIFITGPVVRNWGFYFSWGWSSHKDVFEADEQREAYRK